MVATAPLTREIRKAYLDWSVTVYVRNTQVDEYLKSNLGANRIVHGTFEESEKIRALAKEHEFVINAGSSFDPVLSAAIIAGLKERPAKSKGTLLHISGAGNFIDGGTTGVANPSGKVWNVCDPFLLSTRRRLANDFDRTQMKMTLSKLMRQCSMEPLTSCK